jgi:hypothetical protein
MGGETIVCASLARGIEARLLELLEDVDDGERVYATPGSHHDTLSARIALPPAKFQSTVIELLNRA